MVDITKIKKLLENWYSYKIDFNYDKETKTYTIKFQDKKHLKNNQQIKYECEELIMILESELKENIDEKGYFMVDDVIYDYKTEEYVRDATEREKELVIKIRNLERRLKNMD